MDWITQNQTIWGTHAGHLPAAQDIAGSSEVTNSKLWNRGLLSTMSSVAENKEFAYFPQIPAQLYKPSIWGWTQNTYAGNIDPQARVDKGAEAIQQAIDDGQ